MPDITALPTQPNIHGAPVYDLADLRPAQSMVVASAGGGGYRPLDIMLTHQLHEEAYPEASELWVAPILAGWHCVRGRAPGTWHTGGAPVQGGLVREYAVTDAQGGNAVVCEHAAAASVLANAHPSLRMAARWVTPWQVNAS